MQQQNNAGYGVLVTHGLVQWIRAHFGFLTASVPNPNISCDMQPCAHVTESARCLEDCTGKSNTPQDVVQAHLINSVAPGFCLIRSHVELFVISNIA